MNKAAIQTSSVTMTRVVTAEGNWKDRFAFGAGASCSLVWVAMSATVRGEGVLFAGAVLDADHGSDPDDRQHGERGGQGQDGDDDGFHRAVPFPLVIHGIADYRAGHAVATAAAPAEFGADDRDDLDPGLAQQGIGAGVAVVGDHHAGCQGDEVVAAVPLL